MSSCLIVKVLLLVFSGFIFVVFEAKAQSRTSGKNTESTPAPALAPTTDSREGMTYTIDGKPVARRRYDAASLANEGLFLLRSNKNQLAMEKLKQALSIDPDLPEAHHSLALVYAKLGDTNNAILEMKKATTLSPQSEAAWITLAGFYQANGNIDDSLITYREFNKRFPSNQSKKRVDALIASLANEKKSVVQKQNGLSNDVPSAADPYSESDDYLSLMMDRGKVRRWPAERLPIRVFVRPGDSVAGYRDGFKRILLKSFADWSKSSEGTVMFVFVEQAHEADLDCVWTDKLSDLQNPGEAADARLSFDHRGIRRGEIRFLTVAPPPAQALSDNTFRVICLHEIGHSLGLSGHTTNPQDIMFYSSSFKDEWRELSARDSSTIKHLYSDKANL